jgi:hypothetical protein
MIILYLSGSFLVIRIGTARGPTCDIPEMKSATSTECFPLDNTDRFYGERTGSKVHDKFKHTHSHFLPAGNLRSYCSSIPNPFSGTRLNQDPPKTTIRIGTNVDFLPCLGS